MRYKLFSVIPIFLRFFVHRKALVLFILSSVFVQSAYAIFDVSKLWKDRLAVYEAEDQQGLPEPGGVVFVGSSSIQQWDTQAYFPSYDITNRGLSGSRLDVVNLHIDDVVVKYKPSVIVLYAGDNDIAHGKTPYQILGDFRQFKRVVDRYLPETKVVLLSVKPSITRLEQWPAMKVLNGMLVQWASMSSKWHYVDVSSTMFDDAGLLRSELFDPDGLHLNEQGYDNWHAQLEPTLAKLVPDRADSWSLAGVPSSFQDSDDSLYNRPLDVAQHGYAIAGFAANGPAVYERLAPEDGCVIGRRYDEKVCFFKAIGCRDGDLDEFRINRMVPVN